MINNIKKNWVAARKLAIEDPAFRIKANLLGTLIGEIEKKAKDDGQRAITDEDCISTIKKFIKNTEETIKIMEEQKSEPILQMRELNILKDFLPKQLTVEELKEQVEFFLFNGGGANMGAIMKFLKEQHAGLYDGKLASEVIKEVLTGK